MYCCSPVMQSLWLALLFAGTRACVASEQPMVNSGTPPGIPVKTDCAIRKLAWDYGRKLQPTRGAFKALYDALQLGACGVSLPPGEHIGAWSAARQPATPAGALEIFVDPHADDDDDTSTPFASIAAAIAAAIATRAPGQAVHIVLRSGTHFLSEPIQLTSAHSRLTIRNYDGEEAIISGGVNLTQPWKPSLRCTGCFEMDLSKQNIQQIHGLRRDGVREIRARYPNFDPELDSTIDGQRHFHTPRDGWIAGHYNKTQAWIPLKTKWIPNTTSTMNGIRGWPPKRVASTFIIRDSDWPDVEWPMHITTNSTVDSDSWTGEGEWGEYWLGSGGTCVDRDPPVGYWCAPAAPRQISTPNHPSGIQPFGSELPNAGPRGYKNATGAVIHAWRPGHWYTNLFEVGAVSPPPLQGGWGSSYFFSRGGTQGGEGVTGDPASEGPYGSAGWYIENVLEELDIGREWFYDERDQTLIYKPNGTAAKAPIGEFVATSLKVLFNISGSKEKPAHHIAISGVTLCDTAYTYFDPHGLPSGGDWALQKQGAITVVGSESVTIDKCLLTRLDGNAIFIGGYNRKLRVTNNELSFIGDSAIASWGDTSAALNANGSLIVPGGFKVGPDGRDGEQPRGTVVSNNICHEIGLWQKQSSMWFQAVTAQTVLTDNIFFNGPRAAFNFNDGFGGGDDISGNLLLNCVRETSDHGPWNSWSRVPYITNIRTGKPSIIPATRRIHNNFILATYFSQQAIDTDDGSAYYEVYDNFFAYGDNGLKSDFGGHDNVWHGNVLAYVGNCYTVFNFKGYNDAFYDNKCVFRTGYGSTCGLSAGFEVHGNSVFSVSGNLTVCKTDWANWTETGHDTSSTLSRWPADAALVAMGKKVLGM